MDSTRFTTLARSLLAAARSLDLTAPVAFRTPPRKEGETRTLRRTGGGSVVLSIAVRDRPDADVILDMVAGLLKANGQPDAITNRDLLLEAAYDSARNAGSTVTRDALGLKLRPEAELAGAMTATLPAPGAAPPCLDDPAYAPDQF